MSQKNNLQLQNTHVKLLAFDLLSLSNPDPTTFTRNGTLLSRAETLGVVVSREHKPNRFLKFSVDDGTGCVACILWLNHHSDRRNPEDVVLLADVANRVASQVELGVVARVRGRIAAYRGMIQVTASDVVVERDPNVEVLHWLQCVKLARRCYGRRS